MNFLSHFYFDRFNKNSQHVIGIVLPDLLKNTDKNWSLRPEKYEIEYTSPHLLNIYTGWKRHIEVDKYFHCSEFFLNHTQHLRVAIAPFLINSPARPFFVAHIALELILDSLLLTENIMQTVPFYTHLKNTDSASLNSFLHINQINETEKFFHFLDKFIHSKYLETYRYPDQIIYALNRICMRVWHEPFNDTQKLQLMAVVIEYLDYLQGEFMQIFDEIEKELK